VKQVRNSRACVATMTVAILLAGAAANIVLAEAVEFEPPQVVSIAGFAFMEEADVDNDGDIDLVVLGNDAIGSGSGFIFVLTNDGNGVFQVTQTLDIGPLSAIEGAVGNLTLGDFDADGFVDLAIHGITTGVRAFFNAGDGTFGPSISVAGIATAFALDAGDLDGDSDDDLVYSFHKFSLSNGDQSFASGVQFTTLNTAQRSATIRDFDNDGDNDIAYGTTIHLNDGSATFTNSGPFFPGSFSSGPVFADLEGDGDLDVVAVGNDFTTNGFPVAFNDGEANFTTAFHLPANDAFLGDIGDLNGDGRLDFVVTHCCNGADFITIFLGVDDGAFDTPQVISTPSARGIAIADFNSDGLSDVALAHSTSDVSVSTVQIHLTRNSCAIQAGALEDVLACPSDTVSFTAEPTGTGSFTFEWRRNGIVLQNGPTGTGSVILGAAASTLTIQNVSLADSDDYDFIVTNACGSAVSAPAQLDVAIVEGDLDRNGAVDGVDFGLFAQCHIGPQMLDNSCNPMILADADSDEDGDIDLVDFTQFQINFGTVCSISGGGRVVPAD